MIITKKKVENSFIGKLKKLLISRIKGKNTKKSEGKLLFFFVFKNNLVILL